MGNEFEGISESDLLRRIQAGAVDEYRAIVARYEQQVFSLLMKQVADEQIARELTQDTFIKAYNGLARFRFGSKFSTWLVRIALNVSYSYFSSRQYRERARSVELKPELLENLVEEESNTLHEELIEALPKLLGSLKPAYRDVVTLCYLEQMTYQQAAEVLEIPYGTVCSRLNKALALLRISLKDSGVNS